MKKLKSFLSSILLMLVLTSCAFAKPLTEAEWTQVDVLVSKIPQGRYVYQDVVVRKEFNRVYIGSVSQEDAQTFLIQDHLLYIGYNRTWTWVMVKITNESSSNWWQYARVNIKLLEVIVDANQWQ